ncbi:MAG: hypothetical protein WCG80_18510 [Spirochaetales bacterium]
MKKIAKTITLALLGATILTAGLSAQPMQGYGGGPAAGIDWKIGNTVTTEYKKSTGQLILGQKLDPVFKADGVEYLLMLPRWSNPLVDAKSGDTITIEGTATTVKADTKVQPVFHAYKITVNGKEVDLTANTGNNRQGMGGRADKNGRGQTNQGGGMMGNGPRW